MGLSSQIRGKKPNLYMRSLRAKYDLELQGVQSFEFKKGFVTFKVEADYVYLQDLFVDKPYRGTNVGLKMLQYVERMAARLNKPRVLLNVCPSNASAQTMTLLAIKYNYKLSHAINDAVFFVKEIKNV